MIQNFGNFIPCEWQSGTDRHVPFGGRKNSSFGPGEQGRSAAGFYTQVKTSYIRSGAPE